MGREIKKVPLDFKWPIRKTWFGYLNPHYKCCHDCPDCEGSGYSERARHYKALWYGYTSFTPENPFPIGDSRIMRLAMRNCETDDKNNHKVLMEARRLAAHFNKSWLHHLTQADVDALFDGGRLHDFKERPTAGQVNEWSIGGMGHDSINCHICIKARCEKEGVPVECQTCKGDGEYWYPPEYQQIAEDWQQIEPPAGDGYQIWETVSEGSPVSPVFATPEELAKWMVDNDTSVTKDTGYDGWLRFINGPGWAMSGVQINGECMSGVKAVSAA